MTVLLDKLWQGKLTLKCDGRLSDFSLLIVMIAEPVRKLDGLKVTFKQILSFNFTRDVEKEKYVMQFRYRKSSIAIIYQKNFYSAIIIVTIFTYINIQYQQLFNLTQFKDLDIDAKRENLTLNLKEFE